jgi:uncharacterized protein YgiM (DUF1202 family)
MIQNKLLALKFAICCLVLSLAISAQAEEKKEYVVAVQKILLRNKPSFLGKGIGTGKYGDKIEILTKKAGWAQIKVAGKTGWAHQSSLQESFFILKEIGKGEAAKSTYKDEVVAAGKGFSPEYEALMKSQSPDLNYKVVDQIESWLIATDVLKRFATKGGLTSEVLQ